MRVAIVEDEKIFARELLDNLDRFAKEQNIAMEVRWFADGSQLIGEYKPEWDLILLDIDMPGMDGITTAYAIREQDRAVLLMFVTNLAQYAIKGYEVEAIDYVLKPIGYEAFCLKMQKVLRIYHNSQEQYVFLKKDGENIRIPISHITYIETEGHRMIFHTTEGDIDRSGEKTLTALEEEYGQYGFARCNSCYLVNLRYVEKYNDKEVLVGKNKLAISRGKKKAFQEAIIYDLTLQTDNEAVNVVFTEKGLLCKKYGIQWTCMIDGSSLDFMSTVDIYTLFGNALDNAIEASRRLSDPKQRVISASSRNQSGMLTIEIENYYEGLLRKENGKLVTSKSDSQNHGYGLNSMNRIVERYGGHMAIFSRDNIFRLVMMFPGNTIS